MSRARLAPSLAPRADRANLTPKLSTLDKWCRALEGVGVEFIDVIVEHSPGVRLQKGNAPRQEDVRRNQQDHRSHEPAGRPALGPARPLGPREDPSLHPALHCALPGGGRDRPLRPLMVQPLQAGRQVCRAPDQPRAAPALGWSLMALAETND